MTADTTREAALKKMSNFKPKIGYPDVWIDYSSMDFGPDGNSAPFLTMEIASMAFQHRICMNEINAPTDRVKWLMTPQTINAYYHPSLNQIVFPAAIL